MKQLIINHINFVHLKKIYFWQLDKIKTVGL